MFVSASGDSWETQGVVESTFLCPTLRIHSCINLLLLKFNGWFLELSFNINLVICLFFFSEIVIRHCIYGNKQLENGRYCTGTTESRADMQYTEDCYFPVARRSWWKEYLWIKRPLSKYHFLRTIQLHSYWTYILWLEAVKLLLFETKASNDLNKHFLILISVPGGILSDFFGGREVLWRPLSKSWRYLKPKHATCF